MEKGSRKIIKVVFSNEKLNFYGKIGTYTAFPYLK